MHAYAGISIVNAIPSWYGSSGAVGLKVKAEIEETKEREKEKESSLIREILDFFESKWDIPHLRVNVESEVPQGSGLKSSSAVSVAIIEEIYRRYNIEYLDPPKLSAILSIKAGVSFTGALDDASSSYYGGISFTNNKRFEIIEMREPPDGVSIVILRKGNRTNVNLKLLTKFSLTFSEIFKIARSCPLKAMSLNGFLVAEVLGYPKEPIEMAMKKGALAAGISGNGPSYFAVTKEGDEGPIYDLFKKFGEPIITRFVKVEGHN
ncbi:shikimate kinase [Sulfuracidifex tepidarius]|uniref:Shikimate kinase n=1 Tax=Sulfuracidifex tepidarius TaxID=1294262 RepID=A0A510DVK0_9CREN|nr:shikimate kinase [Sulfuracidifex tepidarius]BBG24252.1 Shikimate kinase [Sulfuracidifex tepidarius]BBG27009.1 Shikimate kinase [Sulfuracidifex tepidarius]